MTEEIEIRLSRDDGDRISEYIKQVLPFFLDLQARTDPTSTTDTAKGKDLAAFRALEMSRAIVTALAGWAIDHQIGLASAGLAFVPLQPFGTHEHPEYLKARAAVDDHRHELAGAALRTSPDGLADPTVARQLVINLLRANPGGFPPEIARMLIEALQELEYGRVHPLLAPRKSKRKVSHRQQQLQLTAITMIAYRVARGKRRKTALQEVADAYGVSPDAIHSWEARLSEELGSLEVSRRKSFARNVASHVEAEMKAASTGAEADRAAERDERYGDKALKSAARSYRALLREKKSR